MPVSIKIDPFSKQRIVPTDLALRVPQARVLAALMPEYPDDPPTEWPLLTRAMLGVNAGYTAISGTVTRALNGVRDGVTSATPHPGLIARRMVEEVVLDIMGVAETNYRITTLGVKAYQAHVASGAAMPKVDDNRVFTNNRYKRQK